MHAALLTWLQISAELAEAAAGADLVVLEGMGRSIETNRHARFRCAAVEDPLHRREPVCVLPGCSKLQAVCLLARLLCAECG